MGLFDSGGKGNSRANTSSATHTSNTTTTQIDNSVRTSDFGAIQAALDIGIEALRMGESNVATAADLAGRGLDTALDATRGALDFSESVVNSNESVARESIQRISDFGGVALGESLDFARDVFEGAGSALREVTQSNLEGLGQLAQQTTASSDDRVAKIAGYALLAVAAAFVLPALMKGARA